MGRETLLWPFPFPLLKADAVLAQREPCAGRELPVVRGAELRIADGTAGNSTGCGLLHRFGGRGREWADERMGTRGRAFSICAAGTLSICGAFAISRGCGALDYRLGGLGRRNRRREKLR